MRNAAAPHCLEVAGALVDARGRRANAHRLPIRRRPQGSSRPRMSKSDTKGVQCTGRMNENLGIMRLCSVRMRTTQAFVSDLDIHGSLRVPAPAAGGVRWGHHGQRAPGNSVSPPRRRAPTRLPSPWQRPKTVYRFVARAGMRPVWSRSPGAGHTQPAPGRVSPQGPPARPRPGGCGPHRARSGSAGPGPRRAPTAPRSPPEGPSPPQDAARRPPAPRGPAHS